MKTLLITCFEPFGGDDVNASYEAVQGLPAEIGGWKLEKLQLPVVFGTCAAPVLNALERIRPAAVLLTGQAGGRKAVTPEMFAHNLRFARIPDNEGNSPMDEPIDDGPLALRSTMDVRMLSDAIKKAGLPAEVSYSAGAYVCNDLYYQILRYAEKQADSADPSRPLPVCFIHVPSVSDGLPVRSLSDALTAAVLAL